MKPIVKNLEWASNLRVIATISVILLHVAAEMLYDFNRIPEHQWWVGNIYDSFVRFSVPAFFMLTGALLLPKVEDLNVFLRKRFLRILPPFLFWSLVYIGYYLWLKFVAGEAILFLPTLDFIGQKLLKGSEWHLWFVYAILGIYLIIPILRRWLQTAPDKEIHYFLFLWSIVILFKIQFLAPYRPSISLAYFADFIGYVVLGYYLSSRAFKINKKPLVLVALALLGIAVTIVATFFLSEANGRFSEYFYGYLSPNVLLVSIAIFLLVQQTKAPKNPILKSAVTLINKHSFGIYLVHYLVLNIFKSNGITWQMANPIISIPLITITCISISLTTVYLLSKIKFGKYIAG